MATEYLMVFCYDIARPRVRARVAALLEDEAVRVQKSVFEVFMTPHAARTLAARIQGELDPEDMLRVYAVGARGRMHCLAIGGAPFPELSGTYIL